jgi:hypothetical protein
MRAKSPRRQRWVCRQTPERVSSLPHPQPMTSVFVSTRAIGRRGGAAARALDEAAEGWGNQAAYWRKWERDGLGLRAAVATATASRAMAAGDGGGGGDSKGVVRK